MHSMGPSLVLRDNGYFRSTGGAACRNSGPGFQADTMLKRQNHGVPGLSVAQTPPEFLHKSQVKYRPLSPIWRLAIQIQGLLLPVLLGPLQRGLPHLLLCRLVLAQVSGLWLLRTGRASSNLPGGRGCRRDFSHCCRPSRSHGQYFWYT